jgi:alpha-D-glucose phosphate-specific phosphoglucomutase
MKEEIKFGTDGWRGIIGDEFTFENVEITSAGIAIYLLEKKKEISQNGIIIGYDSRFLSESFAKRVAEVIGGYGIPVYLTDEDTPTPAVAYTVFKKKLAGGIVVTASHNPPEYQGIKFKPEYAGSATKEITDEIEEKIREVLNNKNIVKKENFEELLKNGTIQIINPFEDYFSQLEKFVDKEILTNTNLKVVIEPMHGAGRKYMEEIFSRFNMEVINLSPDRDVLFGGRNPEPILPNLKNLQEKVVKYKADLGLAIDGDGDRVGAFDEKGNFLDPHRIFSLLVYYLLKDKNKKGDIAKTVNTTFCVNKIAEREGIKLHEVKVGFKHIAELMLKEDILIGGEESGGIAFKEHIPERDGILASLLLAEMVANKKMKISQIYEKLSEEFGNFYYKRYDYKTTPEKTKAVIEFLSKNSFEKIAEQPVESVNNIDGFKYILQNGDWLMIRPSGTEPLIRIYAETQSQKFLSDLIEEGIQIVEKC